MRKSERGIPNIFIAGFQKCATTTLFEVLRRHPEVGSIDAGEKCSRWLLAKEPGYFGAKFENGFQWYRDLFKDCHEPNLIEATPIYIANPTWMERISLVAPEAKIILSIRDPISRAYSAWNHWKQLPEENRWRGICDPSGSFRSNIIAELKLHDHGGKYFRLVGAGYYYEQIEHAMEFFARGQIHITSTEWLAKDFNQEIAEIQRFLGLQTFSTNKLVSHQRKYSVKPIDSDIRELLREEYKSHDDQLRGFLNRELPWD